MKNIASAKPEVLVVAGLLWRGPSLLVQQRPADKVLPLLWEFPGGKVELGESCETALARECAEELGVTVLPGPLAWETSHDDVPQRVRLRFYHATLAAGAIVRPTQAAQWAWLTPHHMLQLPFCPADVALVQALADGHIRPFDC